MANTNAQACHTVPLCVNEKKKAIIYGELTLHAQKVFSIKTI